MPSRTLDQERPSGSRQALDRLKAGGRRLAVAVEGLTDDRPNGCAVESVDALETVVALLDALCQGWTASRARAVAGALRGWTQQRIAQDPGVSQPYVAKALAVAHWDAVESAIEWWERAAALGARGMISSHPQ